MARLKLEDKLQDIKDNIRDFRDYFRANFERYKYFQNFIFKSSISDQFASTMQSLGRPTLEFNILEAYISRWVGEWAKHEPDLKVSHSDGVDMNNPVAPELLRVVEGYIRHIIYESNKDNTQAAIYMDILSGGFSGMKVFTEYVNDRSFQQNILFRRVFDPTLMVFDKNARESHKGDGMYCGELYPMDKDTFEDRYGKKHTDKMKFTRSSGGSPGTLFDFSWSFYNSDLKPVVLVADYYEKVIKKEKIVQVRGANRAMTMKEYEKLLEEWELSGVIDQPPATVGKPRETEFVSIDHYFIAENSILDKESTDYQYLPLIFVDGNSRIIQKSLGCGEQMTRPIVYHAEGIQKLKNFAGSSLANELENIMQSKMIAAKESIPDQYLSTYLNPQKASMYIYNAFKDNDPNVPLPPPSVIARPPIPQEIVQTFSMSDSVTQAILGSYDAALGINNNQLSGRAITAGATQSNSASQPWSIGYMKAYNRLATILIDLMPKYFVMPRMIPTRDIRGREQSIPINTQQGVSFDFDSNAMKVKVEAGVNFEIQRQQAIDNLMGLMQASPVLGEMISTTEPGIEMILDNIDMRGIDALKSAVPQFMQQKQQQNQQMQQMQMQMNPMVLKQQEIEQKKASNMLDFQATIAKVNVEQQKVDNDRMIAQANIGLAIDDNEIQRDKLHAERERTTVEAISGLAKHQHQRAMDVAKHASANLSKENMRADVNKMKNSPK